MPLAPADRARLAAELDMISDRLAEIGAQLHPPGARRCAAAWHADRARRAAESSVRALDRLSKDCSPLLAAESASL